MRSLSAGDFPAWTTPAAWAVLIVAIACAVSVGVDVARRPQKMGVMNAVWPLVMLFGSVVWLGFYLRFARARPRAETPTSKGHDMHGHDMPAHDRDREDHGSARPGVVSVAIDTNHCGAGCSLGDIVGEGLLVAVPAVAGAVGLGTLYRQEPIAGWIAGTVLAFVFGIAFQYFAIAPMRGLGVGRGLVEALKADAASIAAWQVGMIGTMALIQLVWLPAWLGGHATATSPQFWVLMQVAMVIGYVFSYPVNWWLMRVGIKEPM